MCVRVCVCVCLSNVFTTRRWRLPIIRGVCSIRMDNFAILYDVCSGTQRVARSRLIFDSRGDMRERSVYNSIAIRDDDLSEHVCRKTRVTQSEFVYTFYNSRPRGQLIDIYAIVTRITPARRNTLEHFSFAHKCACVGTC